MDKSSNDILSKLVNNHKLLFLIPNLIVFYRLFYYYNQNFSSIVNILFYEIILSCLLFLIINSVIYFFLNKALKDHKKVFCLMCFISLFYFTKMSLISFLILVIFILLLVIDFKYLFKFSLDYIVGIVSFIVLILFSFTFLISIYDVCYMIIKSKSFDYKINFKVEEKDDIPNIYWIHCDGMMSQEVVKKYYDTDVKMLANYFKKNDYFYNKNASLVTGHSTQRALVSMWNPYYYDNFFQNYLFDLEKTYLKEKKRTDFIVSYYELEEKRMHNELFQALQEQGYETVAIADYSSYTALYVDHYYDYFYYDEEMGFNSTKKEFRYINSNNSKTKLLSYLRFNHLRPLFYNSLIYPLMEDINFLDYDFVDYNDINLSDYPYTNKTSYWFNKAIFKGVNNSFKNNKQFTFIDYKLPHVPFIYDAFGNENNKVYTYEPIYYLGHYIYSGNLLIELLDYIQSYDKDAVIIVQGDHGIHTIEEDVVMNKLNTDIKGVQEIRNSVINAVYVPEKYRNGDENVLGNPLNISRYLVNNYVGDNYEYVK